MISKYLSSIDGVEIFPIIVLLLFFSIFMGMIIWIIRMDKKYVTKMENMPLDSSDLFKTKLEVIAIKTEIILAYKK